MSDDDNYDDEDDNYNTIDADDDGSDGGGSAAAGEGATAVSVLTYLAKSVVEHPDEVKVEVDDGDPSVLGIDVFVDGDDMGRVIGKRGRVANAIRTVVRAAASADDVDVDVEFVD
jgi:predicted RNA-binding protein YlqC (UPF0109 family)